jgi:hypothetical protein
VFDRCAKLTPWLKTNLSSLRLHHVNLSKRCKACVDNGRFAKNGGQPNKSLSGLRKLTAEVEVKPVELEKLKQQLHAVSFQRMEDAEKFTKAKMAASRLENDAESARSGAPSSRGPGIAGKRPRGAGPGAGHRVDGRGPAGGQVANKKRAASGGIRPC